MIYICDETYTGETGRCFKIRLSEHKRDPEPLNLAKLNDDNVNKKTALVKHCYTLEHRINWKNTKILAYEISHFKRRFLESWFINLTQKTMNEKDFNNFSKIYKMLFLK